MIDELELTRPDDAPGVTVVAPERPRQPAFRWTMAALSLAAGGIHLAMVPSHWGGSAIEGIAFAAVGWFQVVAGVVLLIGGARTAVIRLLVVANLGFLGVWVVSRTWGLPFGEHSGHPHDAGFVDLTCVAFQAALVLAALAVLRRPSAAAWSARTRYGAAIVPLAVIGLATAALASPSARDHADASHGTHAHGEGAAAADGHADHEDSDADVASGLAALQNGHQHGGGVVEIDDATQAALSVQLAETTRLIAKYPTIAEAEAAGYRRAGPFSPGLGTHYSAFGGHGEDSLKGANGEVMSPTLIYDGTAPESPIAGFMYSMFGKTDAPPEGFVGPNDHWHYHSKVCIVFKNGVIEAPLGADRDDVTTAMCDEYGGTLIENTGYMVHVWTVPGYESPRGTFSEVNPKITCPDGTYHMMEPEEIGSGASACRGAT
jgi:hypothetical protein